MEGMLVIGPSQWMSQWREVKRTEHVQGVGLSGITSGYSKVDIYLNIKMNVCNTFGSQSSKSFTNITILFPTNQSR